MYATTTDRNATIAYRARCDIIMLRGYYRIHFFGALPYSPKSRKDQHADRIHNPDSVV